MTRRLFLNSLSAAVLYAVNIVIAFILSPIVVHELGNRDYGIWEMLLSFCGYFGILELGLGPAIIRYVAREIALQNSEGLTRVFNSAFWGLLSAGLLALGVISLAAVWPERLLNLQPGEISSLSTLCVIAGLSLFVQFLGTLFVAFLMGRQEYFKVNLFRSGFYIIQAFFVFLALTRWSGSKLLWIAIVTLAGNICQYLVLVFMCFGGKNPAKFSKSAFSWDIAKEVYRFGFNSAVMMVSDRVQRQSLPLIIGHVSGAAIVVFYALPKRLVDYARDFVIAMSMPLMPYFSSIDAVRRNETKMKEWFPASRAVSFLAMPAAGLLLLLGEPFLNIWIGPEYGDRGKWVVIFLSASFWVTSAFSNSSRVLIAGGQHGPPAKKALLISAMAILLAIPATLSFGVSGSALVVFLANLAADWVFWKAASNYVNVGLSEHFHRTIKPLTIPILFLLFVLVAARRYSGLSSYSDLSTTAFLSISLYLAAAWRFALTSEERATVRSGFSKFSSNSVAGLRKAMRRSI
jgi:O-antigen/teichoic acid export membrane protein